VKNRKSKNDQFAKRLFYKKANLPNWRGDWKSRDRRKPEN
jgi:hypothetical protein